MERALKPLTIDEITQAKAVIIELPMDGEDVIEEEVEVTSFGDNLAEALSDGERSTISSDILSEIRIDKSARNEWEKTVTEGLTLLGMTIEDRTEPWAGACGVFHSIMSEAVIKFQSEMILETFPANGPVHTKIIGKLTKEKEDASFRVKEDMNWQLLDNMTEYRLEHERMLWSLGFVGCSFKKVYFDPALDRQVSMFVPAEDMYLPYGSTDISTASRSSQLMKKSEDEINELMDSGFYVKSHDLGTQAKNYNTIDKKKQKLSGVTDTDDDRYVIFECQRDLSLECDCETDEDGKIIEKKRPYLVTLNTTGTVYAIYRNWDEENCYQRRDHFVQYNFIPGLGPYGFGYVHILGGYAKAATAILRQLVDAGTLSNLPGGLKSRGLRIKGDQTPIAPGEFRDVDVPAGTIRDNIMSLPYKEPSATLFGLFKEIVDEARMLASTADMKVADMNQQAPVGTTLAIIERMMKVMSAVQARAHASMKREFKLLKAIIRDETPDEYPYETGGDRMVKRADYDMCDVIPVSDPNSSSSTMRMAQYQAAIQLSATAPQLYDLEELHRGILTSMGMKNANKIVPAKDDLKPRDPVTENMNIMNGKPVKAFIEQDQDSHIAVHMSAAQDPEIQKMVGQNPRAAAIQMALQAHLMEHMAFKYRQDLEKQMGVQLPTDDKGDIPEEIELGISRLAAEAAPLVLAMHSQKAAQAQIAQQQQDPLLLLQQKELQIKEMAMVKKDESEEAKLAAIMANNMANNRLGQAKLQSAERIAMAKIAAENQKGAEELQHKENVVGFNASMNLINGGMKKNDKR